MDGKVPPSANKRQKVPGSGGSRKGIPNKATADIKAAAAIHGPAALQALISIAENDEAPPSSRVAAAVALLDRGFGKPSQSTELTGKDGGPIMGRIELVALK
jgi:hypothetical protein